MANNMEANEEEIQEEKASEKLNKRRVGRPLKFKKPKDLLDAINEYFNDTDFGLYTVTGLALVIGSKQLLADYEGRDDFGDIVKEAKLMIENSYEIDLKTRDKPTGAIFGLKNFGWRDKVDIDHGGKVEIVRIIDDIPKDA